MEDLDMDKREKLKKINDIQRAIKDAENRSEFIKAICVEFPKKYSKMLLVGVQSWSNDSGSGSEKVELLNSAYDNEFISLIKPSIKEAEKVVKALRDELDKLL